MAHAALFPLLPVQGGLCLLSLILESVSPDFVNPSSVHCFCSGAGGETQCAQGSLKGPALHEPLAPVVFGVSHTAIPFHLTCFSQG